MNPISLTGVIVSVPRREITLPEPLARVSRSRSKDNCAAYIAISVWTGLTCLFRSTSFIPASSPTRFAGTAGPYQKL
jgi:hypothetical protein